MSSEGLSHRRNALKAGFALLAFGVMARQAKSETVNDDYEQPKLDRELVKYRESPGPDGHACGNCTNYIGQGHCRVVAGEVALNGYCLSYAPKDVDF